MKRLIILCVLLTAAGCNRSEAKDTSGGQQPTTTPNSAADKKADNTAINERDRGDAALTPGDQGSSESDRTITQQIRQGVVKEDGLSITAKNVKIITVDGAVTLRGPVKSDKEKSTISGIAQGAPGVKRVVNQLEIAAN